MKKAFKMRIFSASTILAIFSSLFLTITPVKAVSAVNVSDTLTREKISVLATHTITGTFTGGTWSFGGFLYFNYDHGTFNLSWNLADATCSLSSGNTCVASVNGDTEIVSIRCMSVTGCSGDLTVGNVTGTNPVAAGSYKIEITNSEGDPSTGYMSDYAIPIVTDDQIVVTATVDPSITFNVGSQAKALTCDGSFSGNGGTVALGVVSPNTLASSDDANNIEHICMSLSTNATNGAVVTVTSTNNGLRSTSVPGDIIPSASETLSTASGSSASQGYGMCGGSLAVDFGAATTTPAGTAPTPGPIFTYNPCNSTSLDVGGFTGSSPQTAMSNGGMVSNGFGKFYIKAMVDTTQPAHNDYTDTLTFIATGTF
jgi:hypothetical protein